MSCGSGSSSNSTGSSAGTGSAPPPLGRQLFGKLLLQSVWPIFDPADQATVLGLRTQLQARGITTSPGGNLVIYPGSVASGYTITLGGQTVVSGPDGGFTLKAPTDGRTHGLIRHPSSDGLNPAEFEISQLSTSQNNPTELVVPIFFRGPCGMSVGDDPMCGRPGVNRKQNDSVRSKLQHLAEVQPRFYNPRQFDPNHPEVPGLTTGAIPGVTYPRPDSVRVRDNLDCPSTDGIFGDGKRPVTEKKYIYSTCDTAVLDGACPNENCLSDVEYRTLIGGLTATGEIGAGVGLGELQRLLNPTRSLALTPLSEITGRGPTGVGGGCVRNHHGRACGEFQIGDVALKGDTALALPGDTLRLRVQAGKSATIVVHNNGVFGYSDFTPVRANGQIHLAAATLVSNGDVQRLEHFIHDPEKNAHAREFTYNTDSSLTINVDAAGIVGESAEYECAVDDKSVRLVVEIGSPVTVSPATVSLFASGNQLFTAVEPVALPGQTFTYEWTLSRATGTLTANARAVTYQANSGLTLPAQDEITVRVFLSEGGSPPTLYGTASAPIRIEDHGAIVQPGSVVLTPGQSQNYSVQVQGQPPGSTLSYLWSSGLGLGTVSPANQASTLYTVNPNLQSPGTDSVDVQVFVTDSNGQRLFAQGHGQALIQITGNTWNSQGSGFVRYEGAASDGSRFVILGQDGVGGSFSLVSTDGGSSFQQNNFPSGFTTNNLRFLNGQFVAVIQSSSPSLHTEIMTSPDGEVWTLRGPTGGVFASDVAYRNGVYVVAGDGGFISHTANLASSVDLSVWTSRGPLLGLTSVKALGARFVACGSFGGGGVLLTSDDGINWTQQTSGTNAALTEAAFNGVRYVAVGNDVFLYSDDGLVWSRGTASTSNNLFERVEYGNGRFRAVGRNFTSAQVAVIYSSSDGINWTPDSYPSIALFMDVDVFRLAFGNGKFLATTVRGQILTNP